MENDGLNLPHRSGFYWMKREVLAVQQCLNFMATAEPTPYQTWLVAAAQPFPLVLN